MTTPGPARLVAGLTHLLVAAACAGGPPPERPSIVVIVVDTLRADRLGAYGYASPTSPAIDELARRGVVFENALATSSWTAPSMGSLLTGEIPSRHGAGRVVREDGELVRRDGRKVFKRADPSLATLAERLRDAGYATAAVVSNTFLSPAMNLHRGFDHYRLLARSPRAPAVVNAALAWLDARNAGDGRPLLLLVHLFDPHLPYHAGPAAAGRFTRAHAGGGELPVAGVRDIRERAAELSAEERAFISAAYDEEIAFVDTQIGRLVRTLEERRVLPGALLVLTSDHGEELFDHGGFEHGHTLHHEILHVPLIFSGAGLAPRRIASPVSLVDVMPTLLEAAALEPPAGGAGASLWPLLTRGTPLPERALVAEGTLYGREQQALVRWPHKLIVGAAGGRRLYDLSRDRGERTPLADGRAPADALARELAARVDSAAGARAPTPDVQFSSPMRERLRALGYLDAP